MRNLEDFTIDELRSEYSDVYKDLHGIRPRCFVPQTKEELQERIDAIQKEIIVIMQREIDDIREDREAKAKAMKPAPGFTIGDLGAL